MIDLIFVAIMAFVGGVLIGHFVWKAPPQVIEREFPKLPEPTVLREGKVFKVFYKKTDRGRPILVHQGTLGGLARKFYEDFPLDGECVVEFFQDEHFRGRRGP